jgi:transposase
MLQRHLTNMLTYFEHRISNAVAEGINAKIQTIKANARGFRSFQSYRYSILFYCGRLDMTP